MIVYSQQTDYTCGPACLRMAISVYTSVVPSEEVLSNLCKSNTRIGTSRNSMMRVVRGLGYSVKQKTKATILDLYNSSLCTPTLVMYMDFPDSWHYAIVITVTDKHVVLADPWEGAIRKIPLSEFIRAWVSTNGTERWYMSIAVNK